MAVLNFAKFTNNPGQPDGKNNVCLQCTAEQSGADGRAKSVTKAQQDKRAKKHLARYVYLFEDGYTFPRAEMFTPGKTLRKVFEENSIVRFDTKRKLS